MGHFSALLRLNHLGRHKNVDFVISLRRLYLIFCLIL